MISSDDEEQASSVGVELSSIRDADAVPILVDSIYPQMEQVPENKQRLETLYKFIILMTVLAVAGAVIIAYLAFPSQEEEGTVDSESDFESLHHVLSVATGSDPFIKRNSLLDPMSPQYLAMEWMAFRDLHYFTSFDDTQAIKQRFALVILFYAAGIESYDEWLLPGVSECNFKGVECDDDSRVVALDLVRVAMKGFLPNELGWLTHLRFMDMSNNRLRGTIPQGLFHLPNLEVMELANNQIDGILHSLPPKLAGINVEHNLLYGKLPGWPLQLQGAKLGYNRFTGTLPDFDHGSDLFHLDITDTMLTGALPRSIANVTNLVGLGISQTQLEGTLPTELGLLTKLQQISMGKTKMEGTLPDELFDATDLQWIIAIDTKFTGTLSTLIGKLSDLQVLNLVDGQFTGSLPSQLGTLPNLAWLQLAMNEWTGTIPLELGQASALQKIWLQGNAFEGTIDQAFCNLPAAGLDFRTDCKNGKIECECCTECF